MMKDENIKAEALHQAIIVHDVGGTRPPDPTEIIKTATAFERFLRSGPYRYDLTEPEIKTAKELSDIIEEAGLETFTDRGGTLRLKT